VNPKTPIGSWTHARPHIEWQGNALLQSAFLSQAAVLIDRNLHAPDIRVADERTRHQRVQRGQIDGDLTVIDGHRVAARIIEVGCRPRALGNETSAQAPDVKPDLRCQVQIDIAHLRFDGGRACTSTHECRCGEGDKHKKREPHGGQRCTTRANRPLLRLNAPQLSETRDNLVARVRQNDVPAVT